LLPEEEEVEVFTPESAIEIFGVEIEQIIPVTEEEPQAILTSVDELGQARIIFDQSMLVPQNLTLITPEMIEFSLRSEYDHYDTTQMIKDWEVIDFDDKWMLVQFYFDKEKFISSNQELDKMEMQFVDSSYFLSMESKKKMPLFTVLKATVDQQVNAKEKKKVSKLKRNAKWLS